MSCCGNQRAGFRSDPGGTSGQSNTQHWNAGPREFEYSGTGQITVTGPLTGTQYRFTNGTPVRVHASDVPSLATIPGIRPVR